METHLTIQDSTITPMSGKRGKYNAFNPWPRAKKPFKLELFNAPLQRFATSSKDDPPRPMTAPSIKDARKPIEYDELRGPEIPEHKLMTAMIERALIDIYGDAKCPRHDRKSACVWIISEDIDPYSFLWICGELSISDTFIDRVRKLAWHVLVRKA